MLLPTERIYTLKDIAGHDSPNDLWMVIYNKVYDISSFVNEHPGGAEVMFDCGGVDATKAFEDVAHSDDALYMLEPYYIGDLTASECQDYNSVKNPSSNLKMIRSLQADLNEKIMREKEEKKIKRKKKKSKIKNNTFLTRNLNIMILISLAVLGFMSYILLQKMKLAYKVRH